MRSSCGLLALAAMCIAPACVEPLVAVDDDVVPGANVGADVVAGWRADGGLLASPPLATPSGATRVAAIVRASPGARVRLFARAVGDGALIPLAETWRDAGDDRAVARADLGTVARSIELLVDARDVSALRSLTFEAMVPQPARSDVVDSEPVVEQAVLDGYQPRSAWGARAASGCSQNVSKTRVTVHHTVQRLNAGGSREQFTAELRAAQALHMDGRGYCDIGYHFLVTADGTVWEGRNASHLGAHTGSNNTDNLGVSFVGCFHPTSDCSGLGDTTPPQQMIDGAGAFIGRAARHYGIALQVGSTLLGHRDNPGQSTACPGNSLHARLGDLATIVGGAPPAPATTGKVQGVVWDLAITDDAGQATALNAKLPGAVVRALQGTTEVARATARDTDAYWSFDVPPGTYTIVATKGGYADGTRQASVTLGGAGWASIGIAPAATASDVSITVVDADTAAPIASATVRFGEDDPVAVDESGVARAARPPGNLRVTVRAEGYAEVVETLTLTAGAPLARTITLTLATVAPPDEPTPEEPPPNEPTPIEPGSDRTRIVIKNAPSAGGGCGCGAVDVSGPAGLATLALLARRRRHHGETR